MEITIILFVLFAYISLLIFFVRYVNKNPKESLATVLKQEISIFLGDYRG